ncbi:HK97-gp10 family putative phage morphogenesis protein [Jiella pelagia]|uniref:HK97 gp10 family phage protein n=1 Tax=Jiella pelagia TaxID=2986949 RepID=A0ABY7BXI7_9HYPH|nr:HK97-gp10 family putative phage morphogenesis protein [Jiella pelagia]WAP67228.1 HK97 gp10 family phage protein [Jiella pelagia]
MAEISRGQKAAATRRANLERQRKIARINEQLRFLPFAVQDAMRKQLEETAARIVAKAKAAAPVRSGALRDSIRWEYGSRRALARRTGFKDSSVGVGGEDDFSVFVSVGSKDVRYSHLVEFGTEHSAAQPFFYPAVRSETNKLNSDVKRTGRRVARNMVERS